MTTYDEGYRAGIEAAARVCRERADKCHEESQSCEMREAPAMAGVYRSMGSGLLAAMDAILALKPEPAQPEVFDIPRFLRKGDD